MVSIIPFEIDKHYESFIALHKSQGYNQIGALSHETVPKIGFIAKNNEEIVAMGFLRLVEGGFGQLDSYVSNASLPGYIRNEGLALISKSLISKAKELNLHSLVCYTTASSILLRADALGFKTLSHSVIALLLQ